MANILVVSNYYPPQKSVASNRIYAFAKYLKQFGHNITVLTSSFDKRNENSGFGGIRVIEIPNTGRIKYANTNKQEFAGIHYVKCLYNLVLMNILVDEASGWTENAVVEGIKLIRELEFDVVISSAPPIGPHIVGYMLKKENANIKWIVDMRDALSWSSNYPWFVRKRLDYYVKAFLRKADAVLAVSDPQLEEYKKRAVTNIPFIEVRNGFDFECINENMGNYSKNKCFTIGFAGTFYADINPTNFLKAVENIINNHVKINIKIKFIGTVKPINIPGKLKNCVFTEPRKNYEEVINVLKNEIDLLLLILPKSRERGIYSGKLFDYLGCCKPILGLVPQDDVAAELIRQANAGYIAENENIIEIEAAILEAYNDWQKEKIFMPNIDVIKKHHRKEQIKIVHNLIENNLRNGVDTDWMNIVE